MKDDPHNNQRDHRTTQKVKEPNVTSAIASNMCIILIFSILTQNTWLLGKLYNLSHLNIAGLTDYSYLMLIKVSIGSFEKVFCRSGKLLAMQHFRMRKTQVS